MKESCHDQYIMDAENFQNHCQICVPGTLESKVDRTYVVYAMPDT